jgi:hypothetical protein
MPATLDRKEVNHQALSETAFRETENMVPLRELSQALVRGASIWLQTGEIAAEIFSELSSNRSLPDLALPLGPSQVHGDSRLQPIAETTVCYSFQHCQLVSVKISGYE